MSEPKKRTNKSKRGMRRQHIKVAIPAIVYCENCHAPKQKHTVCYNCGTYKSKQVLKEEPATADSSK